MPFEIPDVFGHVDWMLYPQYWLRTGYNDAINGSVRQTVTDFQHQYDEGYDMGLYQLPHLDRSPYV